MIYIMIFLLGLFVGLSPTLWRYAVVIASLVAASVLLAYIKVYGYLLGDNK